MGAESSYRQRDSVSRASKTVTDLIDWLKSSKCSRLDQRMARFGELGIMTNLAVTGKQDPGVLCTLGGIYASLGQVNSSLSRGIKFKGRPRAVKNNDLTETDCRLKVNLCLTVI